MTEEENSVMSEPMSEATGSTEPHERPDDSEDTDRDAGEPGTSGGGGSDLLAEVADDVPKRAQVAVQVEELREELEELNDRHLRLAAEFDNYRRRSQAQLLKSGVRAQADLVSSLLDALDDFGRVTSVDPETATVESVLEGIALVERKLFQLLEEAGLEELDPAGSAFDPNVMEAMARAPADSQEEDDTVDEVFQKGFRFGGQLVRPARVSVRKFE
jgi:molecular chaperone GrpE